MGKFSSILSSTLIFIFENKAIIAGAVILFGFVFLGDFIDKKDDEFTVNTVISGYKKIFVKLNCNYYLDTKLVNVPIELKSDFNLIVSKCSEITQNIKNLNEEVK